MADPYRLGPEQVFRAEYGAVMATVIRRVGNIERAEEAVGEAFEIAVKTWTVVPPNPAGWLVTTAVRRAIDTIRRESTRDARQREATHMLDTEDPPDTGPVADDRLRLIFTCCHPALALPARVALTLRLLGGLSVAEIANAFLVEETTMAQRLTRAKRKIAQAHIPYRVPSTADLPIRLAGVLAVLYLVFNEGYLASTEAVRDELCAEAIRLARVLRQLLDEPEVVGLLALLLLLQARRPARFAGGELIPLDQQDRTRWDWNLIAEGHALVRECLRRNQPGQYQILAAINAVHTDAGTVEQTDWTQIVALYDQLLLVTPTPIVELNRAVAVAELDGPQVGLALVEKLPLAAYHPWHATRAELLRRLGRPSQALDAYERAIELAGNPAEREFLRVRRALLD